jgi:hypothetical protein
MYSCRVPLCSTDSLAQIEFFAGKFFAFLRVKNNFRRLKIGPQEVLFLLSRTVNRYRFFDIDTFETESILGFETFETFDTFDTDEEKTIFHFHIYSKFFSQLHLKGRP